MSKKNKTLQLRNKQIYADYITHIRNGTLVMDVYALVAHKYELDADYIRQIIRYQARTRH